MIFFCILRISKALESAGRDLGMEDKGDFFCFDSWFLISDIDFQFVQKLIFFNVKDMGCRESFSIDSFVPALMINHILFQKPTIK